MLITLCLLFMLKNAHGEEIKVTISGVVTDVNDKPITGVTVIVNNTTQGSITDFKGRYSISCCFKNDATLEFSFLGYKKEIRKYQGKSRIDVVMSKQNIQIDDVVVVARQNINDIDLRAKSGVVEKIDMKHIKDKPMINMALALQGAIPGLVISSTGELGSKPKIRIRGNSSLREGDIANEPLYVVDGKVISADAFFELDPYDIKEIVVLKDAVATALYGIKAANGVLEITSQRGISGKAIVSYNFEMGVTMRGRRGIEMMDSKEKLDLELLLKNPNTPGYRYSEEYIRTVNGSAPNLEALIASGAQTLDSLRNINTDWFDYLIKSSLYQKHNFSIKGGSEQTTYFLSGNYAYQGGRIAGNDMQRLFQAKC